MSGNLLQFRDDYLNYRDTVALRLLLLLGIFLFHAGYEFGYVFPNAGYTFVAGFFFLPDLVWNIAYPIRRDISPISCRNVCLGY